MAIMDNAVGISTAVIDYVGDHPVGSAIGAGAAVVGGGLAIAALSGGKSKKRNKRARSKRRKITHTKRGWKQDRKRRSKQKWELAYQRRKRKKGSKKSRRGVHYTKNGQPYILLSSGKAKFIKGKRRKR